MPNRTSFFLFAGILIGSSTVAQPLSPGETISTELLEVRVPAQEGWIATERSPARVALSREGGTGTIIALASVFRIDAPRDKDNFLELIQRGVDADTPGSRYRKIDSTLSYEDDKEFPCVRLVALHEDLDARLTAGGQGSLLLQTHSQYCMHPHYEGVAFMAGFSYRGEEQYERLDEEASQFIEGVTVREE